MYAIYSSHNGNPHPNTTIADNFEQAWHQVCYKLSMQVYSYLQVGHFKLEYLIVDPATGQQLNLDIDGIEDHFNTNKSLELQVHDAGQLIYTIILEQQ